MTPAMHCLYTRLEPCSNVKRCAQVASQIEQLRILRSLGIIHLVVSVCLSICPSRLAAKDNYYQSARPMPMVSLTYQMRFHFQDRLINEYFFIFICQTVEDGLGEKVDKGQASDTRQQAPVGYFLSQSQCTVSMFDLCFFCLYEYEKKVEQLLKTIKGPIITYIVGGGAGGNVQCKDIQLVRLPRS